MGRFLLVSPNGPQTILFAAFSIVTSALSLICFAYRIIQSCKMCVILQDRIDIRAKTHYPAGMFETYLDQLERRAADIGVDLADVCKATGVAATTLARARQGKTSFTESTARKMFEHMEILAKGQAA
jgi:hypothetical protein